MLSLAAFRGRTSPKDKEGVIDLTGTYSAIDQLSNCNLVSLIEPEALADLNAEIRSASASGSSHSAFHREDKKHGGLTPSRSPVKEFSKYLAEVSPGFRW